MYFIKTVQKESMCCFFLTIRFKKNVMSIQVSFRVVGVYCYFENIQPAGVTASSSVKDVMNAISQAKPNFTYTSMTLPSGKELVHTMSYDFTADSKTPYSTSGRPDNGERDLPKINDDGSLVWQYYRSVTGTIDGTVCEIKLFNDGQPSYATTPLNNNFSRFGSIPSNFKVSTYNLTWRLVKLQMSPDKQADFMVARANAIKK